MVMSNMSNKGGCLTCQKKGSESMKARFGILKARFGILKVRFGIHKGQVRNPKKPGSES